MRLKVFAVLLSFYFCTVASARDFTVTIPDNALAGFATDFLVAMPIPTDAQGAPLYTPVQWVRKCVVDYLNAKRQEGKAANAYFTSRPTRTDDVQ